MKINCWLLLVDPEFMSRASRDVFLSLWGDLDLDSYLAVIALSVDHSMLKPSSADHQNVFCEYDIRTGR